MQQHQDPSADAAIRALRTEFIEVMEAIVEGDLDVAGLRFDRLMERSRLGLDNPGLQFLGTVLAIQRGDAREALHMLGDLDDKACPELRVLCLYSLGDPVWEGMAEALLESPDATVRTAMASMLDRYRAVARLAMGTLPTTAPRTH